jgi:hypothetical protein
MPTLRLTHMLMAAAVGRPRRPALVPAPRRLLLLLALAPVPQPSPPLPWQTLELLLLLEGLLPLVPVPVLPVSPC